MTIIGLILLLNANGIAHVDQIPIANVQSRLNITGVLTPVVQNLGSACVVGVMSSLVVKGLGARARQVTQ